MLNIDDRFLKEATCDQFWLMCQIARFMNEGATCFPSNQTLCDCTGWKISKLNEVKKACIDAGYLEVEARYLENKQRSNVYKIATDRISVMVNLKGKEATQANEIPTAPAAPYRHSGTTPTATAAPEVLTIVTSSYTETFKSDFRVLEAFSLSRKIPRAKFDDYLAAWVAEIAGTGETYNKTSEAVKHFLNFSSSRHRIETAPPAVAKFNRATETKPTYTRPTNIKSA